MKLLATLSAGAVALLMATGASAAPLGRSTAPETGTGSMVETVQAWTYNPRCAWSPRLGAWVWVDGAGRRHPCRPPNPGAGYIWYSEGPRQGWYHPGRKAWHFNFRF